MTFTCQKKKALLFFISLLSLVLLSANKGHSYTTKLYGKCLQGNGIRKTVERKATPFNILEISGHIRVNAHSNQIDKYIRVTSDENLLPLIKTSSQGNQLIIYPEKPVCPELEITIDIAAGDLSALIANSSAKISIDEIYTGRFALVANGAGDIELSGYAGVLDAELIGSGDFESGALKTRKVIINSSGNGMITVHAAEKLQVDIIGAADVYYSGNPREIIKSILGPGSLNEAN
ncbi:MAG: head GIN domain-containing protein [Thermodesulfobacteriota bacterium]